MPFFIQKFLLLRRAQALVFQRTLVAHLPILWVFPLPMAACVRVLLCMSGFCMRTIFSPSDLTCKLPFPFQIVGWSRSVNIPCLVFLPLSVPPFSLLNNVFPTIFSLTNSHQLLLENCKVDGS
jgi:hypothetical protein